MPAPRTGGVDASELRRLSEGLEGHEVDALERDLARAVAVASTETMARARQLAAESLFTGELTGSINARGVRVQRTPERITVRDLVFASAPHALVIEEGRRPGAAFPPLDVIRRWVALKVARGTLDVSWTRATGDAAIDAATYLIAVSIHRRGILPRRFMDRAGARGERVLVREVNEVSDRWRARIERG